MPRLVHLERVGDHAALVQVHHAVADHFRVHAQVLVVPQEGQHALRQVANADLNRGPVLHEVRCDDLADLLVRGVRKVGSAGRSPVLWEGRERPLPPFKN